jgi:DNA invertase Pin-like site-specific DNA recombinase
VKAAIYTRVSTTDQNSELQIRELNEYATEQGWEIVETYSDVMSGAKASRPGLNRLMADAMARKFHSRWSGSWTGLGGRWWTA